MYYEDPSDLDAEVTSEDWDAFVSDDDKLVCLVLHGISQPEVADQLEELLQTVAAFLRIPTDKIEVESTDENSVLVFLRMPLAAVLDLMCAFGDPNLFHQLVTDVRTAVPTAVGINLRVGNFPALALVEEGESLSHRVQPIASEQSDIEELFEACKIGDYDLVYRGSHSGAYSTEYCQ